VRPPHIETVAQAEKSIGKVAYAEGLHACAGGGQMACGKTAARKVNPQTPKPLQRWHPRCPQMHASAKAVHQHNNRATPLVVHDHPVHLVQGQLDLLCGGFGAGLRVGETLVSRV